MKNLFLFVLLFQSLLVVAQDDNLSATIMPKNFKARSKPILNIGLVYYGDYYKAADLDRVRVLFEKRFAEATDQAIKLNTVASGIFPFKLQLKDFPEYRQEFVTEPTRLQRLLYYDKKGMGVVNELYHVIKEDREFAPVLSKIDALVVVTGAQFDALGFASGRVAITENPMEIAWGLSDGGLVEFVTDERVVDELIHELGHVLGLDHASKQCHQEGMDYQAMLDCCKTSEAKDDVMSYCRARGKVQGEFFYGFSSCHLRNIKERIVPAMLNGSKWMGDVMEECL